jgi:diadenosine tetraphosphate (Ap4A) HIT family hydrolase
MRDYARIMDDLYQAAGAISSACSPDLMNYASMGNVVPHVHWHLVPRYRTDPRWGFPIYTSDLSDMSVTTLADTEYRDLLYKISEEL